VTVFAVPHPLQGPGFAGFVDDENYSDLVHGFIRDGVDFVFEEASGLGPSIAEHLAESLLGPGRYLDFDPPLSERHKYGIGIAGGGELIEPGISLARYEFATVDENRKREEIWTRRVAAQPFDKGLAICGVCHGLSFAFRLVSSGMHVERSYSYIPHHKLK